MGEMVELFGPEPRPVVVAPPEIELLERTPAERILLETDFPDESNVVACVAQKRGVGLIPLDFREHIRRRETDLMHALVLAVHETHAARHAHRRHDMGVGEPDAVPREPVDVGRLKHRMTGNPEGVRPLIVGQEKNDVRTGFDGCRRLRPADRPYCKENKQRGARK